MLVLWTPFTPIKLVYLKDDFPLYLTKNVVRDRPSE